MKLSLLLLLSLFVSVLTGDPRQVTFSLLTKAAYLQGKKAQISTKPQITYPLKKQRGRIVIPTTKGQKVLADIIIDEAAVKKGHGEDEMIGCTYLGYLTDFQRHLVQVQYYETTQWLLIADNGKQLILWGEPLFSPDRTRIVSICSGIEYGGGQPNIMQLLEMQNGVLREVWSVEPKNWEPHQICWLSPSTLLLSKVMWTGKNPGTTFTYTKLTVK